VAKLSINKGEILKIYATQNHVNEYALQLGGYSVIKLSGLSDFNVYELGKNCALNKWNFKLILKDSLTYEQAYNFFRKYGPSVRSDFNNETPYSFVVVHVPVGDPSISELSIKNNVIELLQNSFNEVKSVELYNHNESCYNSEPKENEILNSTNNKDKNVCDSIGLRKNGKFCSADKLLENQTRDGDRCDNNFECSSNVCVSSQCISGSLIDKILNWFKKLFGI